MQKTSLVTLCLVFLSAAPFPSLSAATIPGSQFFYLGMGARQFSLGGSAAASFAGSAEDIWFNPAALALNEQFRFGASWGAPGTDNQYGGLGFSWPGDRGVFTVSGAYSAYTGDAGLSTGTTFLAKGAYSKQIMPTVLFGFGLNLAAAFPLPGKKLHPGISTDLGVIILGKNPLLRDDTPRGFRIDETGFGFSLLNLGLNPDTDDGRPFPDPVAKAGAGFRFYRSGSVELRTRTDLSLAFNDRTLRWGLGVDAGFLDMFRLRAGLQLGNPDLGPLTLGASFMPNRLMGDNPLEIAYSFIPVRFNGGAREFAHFFSVNFTIGGLDRTAPEVKFTSVHAAFSPNGDGRQDTVAFALDVRDDSLLKGWRLTLHDDKGGLVRSMSNTHDRSNVHSFKDFFTRLFARERSIDSPDAWIWDGRDASGRTVPDGVYTYQADAVDANLNRGYSAKGTIIVDTAPPVASLAITPLLFSPDGDGRLDTVRITHTTDGPAKSWLGEILDREDRVVRSWEWRSLPPSGHQWDGRNNSGKKLPDGQYRYRLTGTDQAGNQVCRLGDPVTLSTKKRSIETAAAPLVFSPNQDGFLDRVRFTTSFPGSLWLQYWMFAILDASGKTVRTFTGTSLPWEYIEWDGRDASGRTVPDGLYRYGIFADYEDGDRPRSTEKTLRIDNTPPVVTLETAPTPFSPDNDGYHDRLLCRISLSDTSAIRDWQLVISKGGEVFRTFSGDGRRGNAFTIEWDGRGDRSGETVAGATTYTAVLTATDVLGNTGTSTPVPIDVDILVTRTANGYSIRIASLEFEPDGRELRKKDCPILDRVAEVLKRHAPYKVIIEGHTDDSGDRDRNTMLSTHRARTVLRYLVRRGIEEDRLLARGLGPAAPCTTNLTEQGRAQNRRIEFMLIKED